MGTQRDRGRGGLLWSTAVTREVRLGGERKKRGREKERERCSMEFQ